MLQFWQDSEGIWAAAFIVIQASVMIFKTHIVIYCLQRGPDVSVFDSFSMSHRVTVCVSLQHRLFFPSSAYQNNDITEFEKILKTNHSNIMDDPFIREHIEGEW